MWTLILALGAGAFAADTPEPASSDEVAAAVACALPPVSVDTLAATISDATGAFAGLDLEGFEAKAGMVWKQLPCVSEPMTPIDVADVYKLRALDAFLAQDEPTVGASLTSALKAAPGTTLPASIAPKGHPLKQAFDDASASVTSGATGPEVDLPVPSEARLLVDGQPVLSRSAERAVLLQLLTMDGAVAWTHLVEPSAEVPAYEALSEDDREDLIIFLESI